MICHVCWTRQFSKTLYKNMYFINIKQLRCRVGGVGGGDTPWCTADYRVNEVQKRKAIHKELGNMSSLLYDFSRRQRSLVVQSRSWKKVKDSAATRGQSDALIDSQTVQIPIENAQLRKSSWTVHNDKDDMFRCPLYCVNLILLFSGKK